MNDRAAFLDLAWGALEAAASDRNDPMRQIVLATHAETAPEARILILRSAARDDQELEVHSDLFSRKISDINANPDVSILAWSAARNLQIRLRARVSIASGDTVKRAWSKVPAAARIGYGGPVPGTAIAAPGPRGPEDATRFAVLTAKVERLDVLELGDPHHRRAIFDARDNFSGQWVAP
ncbi:MAG: pyridoxamine 5'-phosphate oxidase family protein [Pseudomonadota bacterium]